MPEKDIGLSEEPLRQPKETLLSSRAMDFSSFVFLFLSAGQPFALLARIRYNFEAK